MLISNHNLRKAIEDWGEFGWPAPRPIDQARRPLDGCGPAGQHAMPLPHPP